LLRRFTLKRSRLFNEIMAAQLRRGRGSSENAPRYALSVTVWAVLSATGGLIGGAGLLVSRPTGTKIWWLALALTAICAWLLVRIVWQQEE
jgi:hypothetical protein